MLREELTRCRHLGFGQDIREIMLRVNVVSAPVCGMGGRIIGCIFLIGTFPESMIEKYGPQIADMTKQVSYKLRADIKKKFM
jgi:DNA-binding IclR family transcriptional regulator